jgi:Na+/proline symporter
MRIIPEVASLTEANPFTEFIVLILIVWWAYYNIDGGGYLAQRLFAARDERHSALGYLWYSIAHICLRPWPWIVVGLCGMALFGAVDDPETYYPLMMREALPPGLFGLVVASFFAAFMSTIDTQLNWGSSLLVNDLYRRFFWKGKSERAYLAAARMTVVGLAVVGALASFAVKDISLVWKLVYSITAGLGTVVIARWYWWRVNAWSEVSAMATALACTLVIGALERQPAFSDLPLLRFPYSLAVTVAVSVPVWLLVTRLTPPVGRDHLERFYLRVRPGGPGWRAIAPTGTTGRPVRGTVVKIIAGLMLINTALVGIGKLVLGETAAGLVLLAAAAAAGAVLAVSLRGAEKDGVRGRG